MCGLYRGLDLCSDPTVLWAIIVRAYDDVLRNNAQDASFNLRTSNRQLKMSRSVSIAGILDSCTFDTSVYSFASSCFRIYHIQVLLFAGHWLLDASEYDILPFSSYIDLLFWPAVLAVHYQYTRYHRISSHGQEINLTSVLK